MKEISDIKTTLANIVGEYSADIVAATLKANNIPYVRMAGEMDVHTFTVYITDEKKAMDCIEKAMNDEIEKTAGVSVNM